MEEKETEQKRIEPRFGPQVDAGFKLKDATLIVEDNKYFIVLAGEKLMVKEIVTPDGLNLGGRHFFLERGSNFIFSKVESFEILDRKFIISCGKPNVKVEIEKKPSFQGHLHRARSTEGFQFGMHTLPTTTEEGYTSITGFSDSKFSLKSSASQEPLDSFIFFHEFDSSQLLFAVKLPKNKNIEHENVQVQSFVCTQEYFSFSVNNQNTIYFIRWEILTENIPLFKWDEVNYKSKSGNLDLFSKLKKNGPAFGSVLDFKLNDLKTKKSLFFAVSFYECGSLIFWDVDCMIKRRVDLFCPKFVNLKISDDSVFLSAYQKELYEHKVLKIPLSEIQNRFPAVEELKGFRVVFGSMNENDFSEITFYNNKILHSLNQTSKDSCGGRLAIFSSEP
eukprot:snap_masked-scaffold_22-processed-gene-5.40-mRNA-1 protein AED:0.76 eAED:1.00 QI:0/-1/0/1/-1/1/1/0/390